MMHTERITLIVKLDIKLQCLCGYSDVYILVKGAIPIAAHEGDNPNSGNKEVVLQNYAPFTDCISETNNTQIDMWKTLM